MITTPEDLKNYTLVVTPAFHLKDRPGRQLKIISLQTEFQSEIPEFLVIEKVKGKNNTLVVKGWIKKNESTASPQENKK